MCRRVVFKTRAGMVALVIACIVIIMLYLQL